MDTDNLNNQNRGDEDLEPLKEPKFSEIDSGSFPQIMDFLRRKREYQQEMKHREDEQLKLREEERQKAKELREIEGPYRNSRRRVHEIVRQEKADGDNDLPVFLTLFSILLRKQKGEITG